MRILFVGQKDRGVRCLEALINAGKNIVGVVTPNKDPKEKFWKFDLRETANNYKLPVHSPEDINEDNFVNEIKKQDIDLIILCGYNQVLKENILSVPKKIVINLHAGKLPQYRGGSPMNWMIINGETEGCATIHQCVSKIDAGPILAEEVFPIEITDTIKDIEDKTLRIYPELLVKVVTKIENNTIEKREQDVLDGNYYCTRIPSDGRIDWKNMSAKNVYDFIRALTHPFPGAFSYYKGKKIFIWKAKLIDDIIKHSPGRIGMRRGDGYVVIAKDKGLLIEKVQIEDDKEQEACNVLKTGDFLE